MQNDYYKQNYVNSSHLNHTIKFRKCVKIDTLRHKIGKKILGEMKKEGMNAISAVAPSFGLRRPQSFTTKKRPVRREIPGLTGRLTGDVM